MKVHATSVISVVYPEWIVYLEIIRSHCYYIHNASQIYPDWLFELAGHFYTDNRKQIAETGYKKDQATVRTETLRTVEPKKLLQVGGFKQKQEIFNTSVLGLKQMRKNKLFFEE